MKESNLQAVLIGATGLVGSQILSLLLADPRFGSVAVFTRRSTKVTHPKLREHIVDFTQINEWRSQVKGDIAFSALGTTRAQAGSIEAQREVDYTYQAKFAAACAQNDVSAFALISSMGASSRSRVPYSKMKGELEDYVQTLGFKKLIIVRPGPLAGPRRQRRVGEEVSVPIMRALSLVPGLRSLRPVTGSQVARATLEAATAPAKGVRVVDSLEVLAMAVPQDSRRSN